MKKIKVGLIFLNLFFCFNLGFAMQKEQIFENKPILEKIETDKKKLENFEFLLTNQQLNILEDLNIPGLDDEFVEKRFREKIKKQLNSQTSLEEIIKNFTLNFTIFLTEENYNILIVFRDLEFFEENEKFYFQFKTILKNKIERTKKNIAKKNIFKFKRLPKKEIFNPFLKKQQNSEFEFSEKQRKELEEFREKIYFPYTENQIKEILNLCFLNKHKDGFTINVENADEKLELTFSLTSTIERKFKIKGTFTIKEKNLNLEND